MKLQKLTVYCDEAGTMPLETGDPPFVVAALAVTKPIVRPKGFESRSKWLINEIERQQGIPHVSYVAPKDGYSETLRSRHNILESMALETRETTGDNAAYVSKYGISVRNAVWSKAMLIGIGRMLVEAIARGPIGSLWVILDQKTMDQEHRALFRKNVTEVGQVLSQEIMGSPAPTPGADAYLLNNIRFGPADVAIRWSDELEKEPVGLRFAHFLASLALRELKRGKNRLLLDWLDGGTYGNRTADITDVLTAPLSEDNRVRWEQKMKLARGEPED